MKKPVIFYSILFLIIIFIIILTFGYLNFSNHYKGRISHLNLNITTSKFKKYPLKIIGNVEKIYISPDANYIGLIIKKGNKVFIQINNKIYGPFDDVIDNKISFSPNGSSYGFIFKINDRDYVQINDRVFGPFEEGYRDERNIEFSEDGRRFGFVFKKDNLRYVQIDNQTLGPYDAAYRIVFSKDSSRFAFYFEKDGNKYLLINNEQIGPFPPSRIYFPFNQPYTFHSDISKNLSSYGFGIHIGNDDYLKINNKVFGPYNRVEFIGFFGDSNYAFKFWKDNKLYIQINEDVFGPWDNIRDFITSRDGTNYAFIFEKNGEVYIKTKNKTFGPYYVASIIAISPDGSKIAFEFTKSNDSRLYYLQINDKIYEYPGSIYNFSFSQDTSRFAFIFAKNYKEYLQVNDSYYDIYFDKASIIFNNNKLYIGYVNFKDRELVLGEDYLIIPLLVKEKERIKKEIMVCETITNPKDRNNCIEKIAFEKRDFSICKETENKEDCETKIITELNESDLCYILESYKNCLTEIAVKNKNMEICKEIGDKCLAKLAFNYDLNLCNYLSGEEKNLCFLRLITFQIKEKPNEFNCEFCDKIPDKLWKDYCMLRVSQKNEYKEICPSIKDKIENLFVKYEDKENNFYFYYPKWPEGVEFHFRLPHEELYEHEDELFKYYLIGVNKIKPTKGNYLFRYVFRPAGGAGEWLKYIYYDETKNKCVSYEYWLNAIIPIDEYLEKKIEKIIEKEDNPLEPPTKMPPVSLKFSEEEPVAYTISGYPIFRLPYRHLSNYIVCLGPGEFIEVTGSPTNISGELMIPIAKSIIKFDENIDKNALFQVLIEQYIKMLEEYVFGVGEWAL